MLTIEQLQELYSTGAHVFTESHLADIALPAETKIWLTDTGLPDSHQLALDVRFLGEAAPVVIQNRKFLPIAYQWEIVHPIGLEEHTGAVYNIDNNEAVYINKDIQSFLTLLYYYKHSPQQLENYIKEEDPSAIENQESFWSLVLKKINL
ncbi:SUKH-4 family immunity protein [Chitinophaga silvisoli]|uniref:SMI1/KNR4 family protein n=1 Tax=Chitinophaga silvisoli TaxID=2291814 RepID=A0A3E1PAC4_9BACT|nr:SUKH-4 family immunity protein [Chitinophaga silvisoli]RFM36978.1 hypothetical protein DXN04_05635 [Chitinophaga silvisoli]